MNNRHKHFESLRHADLAQGCRARRRRTARRGAAFGDRTQWFRGRAARRLVKQINRELVERWAVVDEHANGDWDDEDLPDEGDLGEADMEDDAFSLPTTFRVGA